MKPFLVLLLMLLKLSAAEVPRSKVVADFLSWYKSYRGSFQPPDVLKAYSARLATEGLTQAEIDQRAGMIMTALRDMNPEFVALHFDHIYMAEKPPFRAEPSRFLMRSVEGLKPGKALDVAMGQGRNALYLASQGWSVTGYDISEEGLSIARATAAKSNLNVRIVAASHDQFDYGTEQWDLIVETFAFTNLSDPGYRKRVVDSLNHHGVLVIEGFGNPTEKGPKNVLFEEFKDLRVILYEDKDEISDWGLQKMRLSRIVVQKD